VATLLAQALSPFRVQVVSTSTNPRSLPPMVIVTNVVFGLSARNWDLSDFVVAPLQATNLNDGKSPPRNAG
jgi:hypothetical protein